MIVANSVFFCSLSNDVEEENLRIIWPERGNLFYITLLDPEIGIGMIRRFKSTEQKYLKGWQESKNNLKK